MSNVKPSNSSKRTLAKTQFNETLAEELSLVTHFTAEEIMALLNHYDAITKAGKLDRLRFREFLHSSFELTEDLMLDLIFRAFDHNADGSIDQAEYVKGLSTMMRGDIDDVTAFCYLVEFN